MRRRRLATGCPVVAYDRGGASESLNACFPQGLVPPDDIHAFAQRVAELAGKSFDIHLPEAFYLEHQVNATLQVYRELLAAKG